MNTHRALISLAKEVTNDDYLSERSFVLHCERMYRLARSWNDTADDASMFLEFRKQSFLDVALFLAKVFEFLDYFGLFFFFVIILE